MLTKRNTYKQPPTGELRQQVPDRMLDSLGRDGSTLVELAKFETGRRCSRSCPIGNPQCESHLLPISALVDKGTAEQGQG